MKHRAMITGIAGFAGSHLAEHLLDAGDHVEGTCFPGESLDNLRPLLGRISLHACDIRSGPDLAKATAEARPDVIYHLAALSSVSQAEDNPKEVLDTNFGGTLALLQAAQKAAPKCRLVYISSSEVYGRVRPEENPVSEQQSEAPVHFYGFTKLISEKLVLYFNRIHGTQGILLRPFNHIGPRQSPQFVCASFARQVARIERRQQEPVIETGNLEAVRDFTDVRDMVKGYRLAAVHARTGGAYNLASGVGVPVRQLLETLLSFSTQRIRVKRNRSLLRKNEIPVLTGNAGKFLAAAPWQRAFTLRQTLEDVYRYWMEAGRRTPHERT